MGLRGNEGLGLFGHRLPKYPGLSVTSGRRGGETQGTLNGHAGPTCPLVAFQSKYRCLLGGFSWPRAAVPLDRQGEETLRWRQRFGFTQGKRRVHRSRRHCNTGSMRGVNGASPSSQLPVLKIHLICCPLIGDVSDIKLIRTDFFLLKRIY